MAPPEAPVLWVVAVTPMEALQVEAVQAESAASTEAPWMAKAPVPVRILIPASAAVRTPTRFGQVSASRRRSAEQGVESGNRISCSCPTGGSMVRDVRPRMAPCLMLTRKPGFLVAINESWEAIALPSPRFLRSATGVCSEATERNHQRE